MISKIHSKQWNPFFLLYQALKVLWRGSIIYKKYIFDVGIYLFHNAKKNEKSNRDRK